MKFLLLGSQGQVGQELKITLAPLGDLICWTRQDIDLTNLDILHKKVIDLEPNIIVNAAAYTAVDKAEKEPELAHIINAAAPKQLALAANECDATLVHISTDYIFDGTQSVPYTETDIPNPQSVYGRSKLAGEQAIQTIGERYAILRTAWVYGAKGKGNFVKTMLRLGAERELLTIVDDQVGNPTWSRNIANTISAMIPRLNEDTYGVYHYTDSGVASWYDLAETTVEEARQLGVVLGVKTIKPIPTEDYPLPAPRPAYSVLSGIKLRKLLEADAPHWQQSLKQMLSELYLQTL